MSDRSVPAYQRRGAGRQGQVIDAMIQKAGGFDPDMWLVMDQRDNKLIEEEILHGAGSSKYVYEFSTGGTKVTGISVVGARELASHYGGIRHTLIGSISKAGPLFVMKSYAHDGAAMGLFVQSIPELRDEPDYYEVVAEIADMKTGNRVQVERKELRFEKRSREALRSNPDLDEYFERPHFQTIAGSKAFRNGVLSIIPQHVQLAWKQEMLLLKKTDVITGSLIDERRSGVLRYAASKAIGLERDVVEELTLDQITGLSEAAREGKVEAFREAATVLGILTGGAPEVRTIPTSRERPVVVPAKAPERQREKAPPNATASQPDKPAAPAEIYAVDEYGELVIPDNGTGNEAFPNPVAFVEWYLKAAEASHNPNALRENNADALEDAAQDPMAKAMLDAALAPEHVIPDRPADQGTPQEPDKTAAAPQNLVPLVTLPNGRPNWAKYGLDVEQSLKALRTIPELEAWEAANAPTYAGKVFSVKIDAMTAARHKLIESGRSDVDFDMDTARDMIKRMSEAKTIHDYEAITTNAAVKSWLARIQRDRPNDIKPMLDSAAKAVLARFAPPPPPPPPASDNGNRDQE